MKDLKWIRFLRKHKLKLIAAVLVVALVLSLTNMSAIVALFRKSPSLNTPTETPPAPTVPMETIDPSVSPEEAIEQLTLSIQETPDDPELYINRAAIYYNQGNLDGSLEDFTTALSIKETAKTRYLRAIVHTAMGSSREAHKDLTAALDKEPDNREYISLMVDTCNALQEYEQALSWLTVLLEDEPDNCILQTLAGDACVYLSRFIDAIPYYEKAIAAYSETEGISLAALYSAYGNCLKSAERYADAAIAYHNSLQLEENTELYFQRGFCHLQSENYTQAMEDFSKCITLEYEAVSSHFQRALCHYATGNYQAAIEDFLVYEKANPDKTDSYLYMGLCYQNLKKYKSAIPYYEKCIEADISAGDCYFNMANCYYNRGYYSRAISSYTKAIALGSYKYESLLNRGLCYIKENKYNEAKADLKKVIDECPNQDLVKSAEKSYEPIKNITIITKG